MNNIYHNATIAGIAPKSFASEIGCKLLKLLFSFKYKLHMHLMGGLEPSISPSLYSYRGRGHLSYSSLTT